MIDFNRIGWIILLLISTCLIAQSSTNYKIEQGTFNNGGNPSPILTSTNYQITLDAIGDGVNVVGLSSASYGMDAGFPPDYRPPGEVQNLRWTSKTAFGWNPEPSAGTYNTYRGTLGFFTGYGACLHGGLTATSDMDTQTPAVGSGYFYLVTAKSRLAEEGAKGYNSSDQPDSNSQPCL